MESIWKKTSLQTQNNRMKWDDSSSSINIAPKAREDDNFHFQNDDCKSVSNLRQTRDFFGISTNDLRDELLTSPDDDEGDDDHHHHENDSMINPSLIELMNRSTLNYEMTKRKRTTMRRVDESSSSLALLQLTNLRDEIDIPKNELNSGDEYDEAKELLEMIKEMAAKKMMKNGGVRPTVNENFLPEIHDAMKRLKEKR